MKKIFWVLSILFLFTACETEQTEVTEEFIQANSNSIVGTWKLIEQNVSIGGPSTWQPVEDGDTFQLNEDDTFEGFQLFSECSTGSYEATKDELILAYECSDNTKPFTYSLEYVDEDIILSPKTVICTETCQYKYRKVEG